MKNNINIALILILIIYGCNSNQIREIKSPLKTYPTGANSRSFIKFDYANDSLLINYTVHPHHNNNVPYIYSLIEVFNKEKKLIKRKELSENDTNSVSNIFSEQNFSYDTIYVKHWGYFFEFVPDTTGGFDSKKVIAYATPIREMKFPEENNKSNKIN